MLLDMGTSNGPEIARLTAAGNRVVVLDHHQILGREPTGDSVAFVNPLRRSETFEHGGKIATVGLAFKFLCAYALSFTPDWNSLLLVEKQPGTGMLFRAGAFCGEFTTEETTAHAQAASPPQQLRRISVEEAATWLGQSPAQFEQTLTEPQLLGRLLFGRIIASKPRLKSFLEKAADIAAIGLMADMVPLVGENRSIVRLGMGLMDVHQAGRPGGPRVSRPFRPGLEALLRRAQVPLERISSRDLSWTISPILNAAGRMGRTDLALSLLLAKDAAQARQLSADLVELNKDRRERTRRNELLASEVVGEPGGPLVFCYHPELEPGVSGIVAARLAETHRRPAVFVNPDGAHARGSARGFAGENVLELIAAAEDLLIQFGGHREAAGFSVRFENIDAVRERLHAAAARLWPGPSPVAGRPPYHVAVRPVDLSWRLFEELERLEPFGPLNPEPVLLLADVCATNVRPLGTDGKHVRFDIVGAQAVEATIWSRAQAFQQLPNAPLDLIGALECNTFQGRSRLRFRVDHFQLAGSAAGSESGAPVLAHERG